MRQEYTKNMLRYWMEMYWETGNKPGPTALPQWPERSDIQPARCRDLLGSMFILERHESNIRYRLAGTNLCSLYGKELKQQNFAVPYVGTDLRSVENWVDRLGIDDHIILLCSIAETAKGDTVNLETLLLPLCNNGTRGRRIVGVTVPCDSPYWLGARPIARQTVRSVRMLRPWEKEQEGFGIRHSITDPVPVFSRRAIEDVPPLFNADFLPSEPQSEHEQIVEDGRRRVAHLTIIDGGLK